MTNEDLTTLILDKLGWDYEKELNTNRYSGTPAVYAGDFVLNILNIGPLTKIAEITGIPYKRLYTITERSLVPLFGKLQGGNETWKYRLLNFIAYKTCSSCQKTFSHSKFGIDNSRSDRLHTSCSACRVGINATNYLKPSVQESHKRSQELHYNDILPRNAKYRAERKQRVPSWYLDQKDKIDAFYAACPSGCHVDHIIPLKGKLVSGLHVIENLQYLPSSENIKKGNRFSVE